MKKNTFKQILLIAEEAQIKMKHKYIEDHQSFSFKKVNDQVEFKERTFLISDVNLKFLVYRKEFLYSAVKSVEVLK